MTRIEAVREAIRVMEKKRRAASVNHAGLKAEEGMEAEYERANETVLALKEICQALQAEGVRKSIAQWQRDLIEDPESVKLAMSDLESRRRHGDGRAGLAGHEEVQKLREKVRSALSAPVAVQTRE